MKRITNVILDRDGTVIVDKHYLHNPDGVELLPGAGKALARLSRAGVRLFLATNQSGIGRGYFEDRDFLAVQERLTRILMDYGVEITDTAYCPHAPNVACDCRKPATGQWEALTAANRIDPSRTVMIGDKRADVGLGLNAGLAASILVLTGKGEADCAKLGLTPPDAPFAEVTPRGDGQPHLVARDLAAAVDWIISRNEAADA